MKFKNILDSGFEISSDGLCIRNIITKEELITSINLGYLRIGLEICNTRNVHRLVYIAHNKENKTLKDMSNMCVDHIDRNKCNNNIENLRLVSYSGNSLNNEKYCTKILLNKITKEVIIADNFKKLTREFEVFKDSSLYELSKGRISSYKNWVCETTEIKLNEDDYNYFYVFSNINEINNEKIYEIAKLLADRKMNKSFYEDLVLEIAAEDNKNTMYLKWSDRNIFCEEHSINKESFRKHISNNIFNKRQTKKMFGFIFKTHSYKNVYGEYITI